MRLSRFVAPAALALALALPAGASAAATWFPAPNFPEAGEDFSPSVVVEPDNDAAMAWIGKDKNGAQQVNVATLPAGPGTPTVQSFPRPNANANASVFPPSLAAAPTGDALVAWTEGTRTIGYSLRQAPGTFASPQTLTVPNTAGKDVFTSPAVVSTDGQGNFLVAVGDEIAKGDSALNKNQERVFVWSVGADGVATPLAPVGEQDDPMSTHPITELSLAENAAGHAALAYREAAAAGAENVLSTSTKSPGQLNPSPSILSFDSSQPRVAVDPAGREVYAVRHDPIAGGQFEVRAFETQPGGASAPVGPFATGTLSDATKASGESAVAIDGSGRATVVWESCDTGCTTRTAFAQRVSPAGQAELDTPQTLSGTDPNPDFLNPQVSVNASGAAVAVWKRVPAKGSPAQLEYARRATATGPWSAAQALPVVPGVSQFGVDFNTTAPRLVGIDSQGNAALGWENDAFATHTPHLARLDDAPPTAGSVLVAGLPAEPFSPLTFTLTPTDRVSTTSVAWAFGDGGTAPGATVRHSYRVGGSCTVTGTATDAAGFTAVAATSLDLGKATDEGTCAGRPKFTGNVSLSHTRFAVGARRTALSAKKPKGKKKRKPPKGTAFRFGLSATAKVKISFARRLSGRRSHGRCVKPTKKLGKARKCTRSVKLRRALTRNDLGKGRHSVAFSGRLGRTKLSLGRYTATLNASNANGRAKARTLAFTIVRG